MTEIREALRDLQIEFVEGMASIVFNKVAIFMLQEDYAFQSMRLTTIAGSQQLLKFILNARVCGHEISTVSK